MEKFEMLLQHGDHFKPMEKIHFHHKLAPGVYGLTPTQDGFLFTKTKTETDKLVHIPGTTYDLVVSEIDQFMKPETRALFDKYGFLYKRSALLYGPPGSGKTCTINRIMEKVVGDGGIVLFNPHPRLVKQAFAALDMLQPETRIMVVFEELDELLKQHESELLNLLDGQIQKSNVIYMATTNFIDKIPTRIRRPGRFASVIEVKFPTAEARHYYLSKKMQIEDSLLVEWVEKTENFSIDELKETVLAVKCLGLSLDYTINKIRENKGMTALNVIDEDPFCDDDCDEDEGPESPLADVSFPKK